MPGWESGKFQLRMDAQNIFNHPAFRNPTNVLNHAVLGTSTPDTSVGAITSTDGNYGRTIQLSGRFQF
jgi:hypothetical protein